MENPLSTIFENRQMKLFLLLFVLILALLGIGYFAFLRTSYAVLFNGLRTADAAAVVTELDSKGVSYKLRDGGATILVPEGEVDSIRLAVTGSDVLSKGTSGFELFNKSDMGLTDFAQKINYQRALQGELARTIMMMDGVADARVHLALPERSLFRGNRSSPKAAVAVTMRRGAMPDEARVAGIQRLVAASVPDLALSDVVVLDELGRVISTTPSTDTTAPTDMEEQEAVRQYYRARARAAISSALPDLKFDVRILVQSLSDASGSQTWNTAENDSAKSATGTGSTQNQKRDFSMRISVITTYTLDPQDRDTIGNAIAPAIAFNRAAGDSIEFAVGPVDPAPVSSPSPSIIAPASMPPSPPEQKENPAWWSPWWVMSALAMGIVLFALLIRGRGATLPSDQRDAFVARIRHQLSVARGGSDA